MEHLQPRWREVAEVGRDLAVPRPAAQWGRGWGRLCPGVAPRQCRAEGKHAEVQRTDMRRLETYLQSRTPPPRPVVVVVAAPGCPLEQALQVCPQACPQECPTSLLVVAPPALPLRSLSQAKFASLLQLIC